MRKLTVTSGGVRSMIRRLVRNVSSAEPASVDTRWRPAGTGHRRRPSRVVGGAEDLRQDRCCDWQIAHCCPIRVVHHLPACRTRPVAVPVWQASGFRYVLTPVAPGDFEQLFEDSCATGTPATELRGIEQIANHHKPVPCENSRSAIDFVGRSRRYVRNASTSGSSWTRLLGPRVSGRKPGAPTLKR